jgi:hypothetical protein
VRWWYTLSRDKEINLEIFFFKVLLGLSTAFSILFLSQMPSICFAMKALDSD